MNATLVPVPGNTAIAEEYRAIVDATARIDRSYGEFQRKAYAPESVRAASRHWRRRMIDEYLSTAVFSGLSAQLVEANATLDTNVVVLRMAQDEFRHAEVCGRVVAAMGGDPRTTYPVAERSLPRHEGVSAEERALRNVLVTSLSETHSISYFIASLDRLEDPYLRAVTRDLLSDEILHGRFGFHYLQAWSDWLAERPAVRASISRYLGCAFAVCEQAITREPSAYGHGPDDARLGLVPHEETSAIFRNTMESAIVPGLERFGLDAEHAWRTRSPAA
jgi:hypothetical protein